MVVLLLIGAAFFLRWTVVGRYALVAGLLLLFSTIVISFLTNRSAPSRSDGVANPSISPARLSPIDCVPGSAAVAAPATSDTFRSCDCSIRRCHASFSGDARP
jgi:hypothetical protein